jgi:hypothetical protein
MEEIKEQAVVCRFCNRDLWLFLPLLNRVSALEKDVQDLIRAVSLTPSQAPMAESPSRRRIRIILEEHPRFIFYCAVSVSGVLTAMLLWILLGWTVQGHEIIGGAIMAGALGASSIAIGLFCPVRLRVLAVGSLLQILIIAVVLALFEYLAPTGKLGHEGFGWMIVEYIVALLWPGIWSCLLCCSGMFCGHWFSRGLKRRTHSWASEQIAPTFVKRRSNESDDDFDGRLKKWSAVFTGLVPILTFITGLTGNILTYAAAIQKHHG